MPPRTTKFGIIATRAKGSAPLVDEPPLGHLQALILKKVSELGSEAYGYRILTELCKDTKVWIDVSQIYGGLRRLSADDKKYVELVGERPSEGGGPPMKIYKLTAAGRAALKATAAHYKALAKYLKDV